METIISGIQQMGIGVPSVKEIWPWYRKNFGMDIKVFEEAAEAPLMTKYTGGEVQSRTATLALNLRSGGGFEIWQYTSRNTEKSKFEIQMGDYGLYICRIKSKDVRKTYDFFQKNGVELISEVVKSPSGYEHFFVKDPNGNIFNIVPSDSWFTETKHPAMTGGVEGTMIGVSDIDASKKLYSDILGFDKVVYDETDTFEDLNHLPGGKGKFRRVLLQRSKPVQGPFSPILGNPSIELIQSLDRTDCKKIFKDRFWGDWGFIHLCFDIQGMKQLQKDCEAAGFPFTVDSGDTFDMGEAGGHFSYVEDPDGTWIEFVETHKVPIMKKLGWYINLKKRDPKKSLPTWMLKAMRFNRVK